MIQKVNKEIISFLFKGTVPLQDPENVKEVKGPERTDMSNLKTGRSDMGDDGSSGKPREERKAEPVRVEKKVGRNDLCPCGSGKKYKQCHGKNE
ncbi:MAG: hypothetical protein HGB12_11795 [Bacteroidetes bacterium]|nr:hypothetical protein [Bacteroidota bacterium]